jgi:hypothetical protein
MNLQPLNRGDRVIIYITLNHRIISAIQIISSLFILRRQISFNWPNYKTVIQKMQYLYIIKENADIEDR